MMGRHHPNHTGRVCSQYSLDYILVDSDAKRKVDLLRDAWATEGGIASFHVDNGINEFL